MLKKLNQTAVPYLKERGFSGKYPDFYREYPDRIEVLTFQTNKWGGSFLIEISTVFLHVGRADSNYDIPLYSENGIQLSGKDVKVDCTNYKYRLNGMKDGWFYYNDLTESSYRISSLLYQIWLHLIKSDRLKTYQPKAKVKTIVKIDKDSFDEIANEIIKQMDDAFVWWEKHSTPTLMFGKQKNKVIRDGYEFNLDLEKSKAFYRDRPIIFPGLSSYLPELTAFLNTLGIDIEKPVKYRYHDSSDLSYKVFGVVEAYGKYELNFHDENRFANISFYKKKDEEGLYLEIFDLIFQQPTLSHFEKSDGWLLYSLSTRFSGLDGILSAGDHYNHAVFTYKELNGGLLRLIQNGYAKESNGKFRITKKGKTLIRRLSYPQWLLGSSTDAMLSVRHKIVNIVTEVEVDYSVDAISNEEYQEAVRKHSLLNENWFRSKK